MSSRPHLSITLPRNFMFHYTDGQLPKTPEPEQKQEDVLEPPAPPRQVYKIKRRKAVPSNHPVFPESLDLPQDLPLPTIETPDDCFDRSTFVPEATPEPTEGYLAPTPSFARPISPPRTPAAQILSSPELSFGSEWDQVDAGIRGESISRPSSACSDLSDSSVSSRGSIGSSFGGSCTSPESDVADPFVFGIPKSMNTMAFSPPLAQDERPMKRLKIRRTVQWTEDMDHHLWITYMKYLQDPTVTPFKMLPGTAPPLGICHRVVREAKKTWKGPRNSPLSRSSRGVYAASPLPAGSPSTVMPIESGSSTPTAAERRVYSRWPHSSAATRRRLRELCKRKPTLSAHYHRLIHNRSPSPFPSSPRSSSEPKSCQLSSPFEATDNASAFSTRDMNISLTTSTAPSMELGNPLSQLTSDAPPTADPNDDVFGPPTGRTSAHQKSQSLQIGLGIATAQHPTWPRMLASPFNTESQNDLTSPPQMRLGRHAHTAPRRLDSPFKLHVPKPLSRSFKRRALHQLNDSTPKSPGAEQNLLKELFGAPAETSHRRVRSRGFSLGDVGDRAPHLSSMFTPPMSQDQTSGMQPSLLAPPTSGHIPRLGSPFVENAVKKPYNTFPRGLASPVIEPPMSIEERLGGLGSNTFATPFSQG